MERIDIDLPRRLEQINKVLSIEKILAREATDIKNIADYYRKNRLAYRLFHSQKGFVHMGVSENNSFRPKDFHKQADLVIEQINAVNAHKVLELAPGTAATIRYLATQKPSIIFYGIDLPNGQLKAKNVNSNINLTYGDYHDLSRYNDNSMDIVYVIEALCHSHDKNLVISEVSRILRDGGRFVVFDGYFNNAPSKLSSDQKIVAKIVMKSMMVTDKHQEYGTFKNLLRQNNLTIVESIDYSPNILPSLVRLERRASRFFKVPVLARFITAIFGDTITANAIAGYLLPICVRDGIFQYRYTVARK
jgi:tocopherol O-methyltransferase